MKTKLYILIIALIFCLSLSSFKSIQTDYVKMLMGSWIYIETRDEKGKKMEFNEDMRILMNEPNLVYHPDFTYRKIFTHEDSDSGRWKINKKTMAIEHQLFIDSTDFIGRDLIKNGLAKKQSDGKYYQNDDDKILKLTSNEMILQGIGTHIVYRKK